MRLTLVLAACALAACALAAAPAPVSAQIDMARATTLTRLRLEAVAGSTAAYANLRGNAMYSKVVLPAFYAKRDFRPAWFTTTGFRPQADALLRAVQHADAEGLRPDDYHASTIARLMDSARTRLASGQQIDPQRWVDLDLLLTDAYLIYASHLVSGRLDPLTKESIWNARAREVDVAATLRTALDSNRVEETLSGLLPRHPGYKRLRERLAELRAVEARGGWPTVAAGPTLKEGDRGPRVARLRAHLLASGDLPAESTSAAAGASDEFDAALTRAVQRFQRRHGLAADGSVGPGTLAALNVPVSAIIDQVALNMERWRWLPQSLGDRYVLVNIAGYELRVVDHDTSVMRMRVVVGKPYRMTPLITDRLAYVVLSPTWTVPTNLAVQDKLPLLRRDPSVLTKLNIHVLRASDMKEVDAASVDWSRVSTTNFPYVLRQDPGPLNALGPAKFMFPNPFDVYLHGTPAQELFAQDTRAFSSGCIRLEHPLDLAELLLRDQPRWTRAAIDSTAAAGVPQTINLTRPLPVHLLYWTVWADDDGTIEVRPDVYGRDTRVAAALAAPAPTPSTIAG